MLPFSPSIQRYTTEGGSDEEQRPWAMLPFSPSNNLRYTTEEGNEEEQEPLSVKSVRSMAEKEANVRMLP
jgi:hypothetical protein